MKTIKRSPLMPRTAKYISRDSGGELLTIFWAEMPKRQVTGFWVAGKIDDLKCHMISGTEENYRLAPGEIREVIK